MDLFSSAILGDVYGRKQALFFSLAGMACVSGGIALSPTYLQVGILAPILFFLGRVLQNFLAAGESMGGAIFLLENAPEKKHDILSSLFCVSTIGGHLLASLGVFLLGRFNAIDPGWRLLYLCGCITALFGCLLRRSSSFACSPVKLSQSLANLKRTLWTCRKPLLCIMVSSGFAYANYSIALVLMNGIIPLVTSFTKTEVMQLNTYLLVLDFCALPFFGYLASRIPREKLMLFSCLGVTVLAIPLMLSLKGASLLGIIGVRVVFVLLGVAFFAPFHAWAQHLIPPAYRYTVISMGYALGSQLLGSPTAAIALWCFKQTGHIASIAWYWMSLALGSALVIAMALRAKNRVQVS